MSHTIFGNRTRNGIRIDDMVDNSNDIVYNICDNFTIFARLVNARENVDDEPKPAIAAFHKDEPFGAIFAKELQGSFDLYWNEGDTTPAFGEALALFRTDCKEYLKSNPLDV